MSLLQVLQEVDRRFLYALLILAVTVPFFLHLPIAVPISPSTRAVYNAIQSLPPDSFVVLGVDWAAGTRGENGPQTEALVRHLFKRKLRFAFLDFGQPQGKTLSEEIAKKVEGEYGAKEGVNWVNWGYRVDMANFLKAFIQDIPHQIGADIHGNPVKDLPVMHGIHSASDIALLIDVTPSSTYQTYIQFLQGPAHLKMAIAPTAVMAPEAFNYLDSGQLIGIVNGLQGAIEYEQLVGTYGRASRASLSLSFAHLLIIAFIIMGNVAMFLERRQKRSGLQ